MQCFFVRCLPTVFRRGSCQRVPRLCLSTRSGSPALPNYQKEDADKFDSPSVDEDKFQQRYGNVDDYVNELLSVYQEQMSHLPPSVQPSLEEFPAREIVSEAVDNAKLVDAIVKKFVDKITEINNHSKSPSLITEDESDNVTEAEYEEFKSAEARF